MKRFFTAMLGSLAAIWISISLLMLLTFLFIVGLVASSLREVSPPQIKDKAILYINLGTALAEINQNANLQSILYGVDENVTLLQPAIKAIEHAETDKRVKGIFIDAEAVSGGVASLKSLHDALQHFKEASGKWVIAYGDQITQGSYYLASTADDLYLNPQGMIDIHGLSASIMYFKGLLEKLGVEVQVLKVGTFKSAVEPYILDSISPANRLQVSQYLGSLWSNLAESMAQSRSLTSERLNEMADSMLITVGAPELVAVGLVDQTLYRHEVEDLLKERINILQDEKLPLISLNDYYADIKESLLDKSRNKVAVLYAVGEISESGNEGITSNKMVPQILSLADDDDVKALVLRVNSPGGSAFASEQIWEALETFKKKGKKFYVSMGDLAASGGYYISCGAEKIYASPVTLTGSIGIFGLIPNVNGLMKEHLGLNISTVSTNSNGDFPNIYEPMTPFQYASMQNMINRGYETFVGRVAEGRDLSVDSVKSIAEGRVWAGSTALEIGLVDELGTLDDAISAVAEEAGLSSYETVYYPRFKSNFWDVFNSLGGNIYDACMRKAMGDQAFELYKKARRAENIEPVLCLMPESEISL